MLDRLPDEADVIDPGNEHHAADRRDVGLAGYVDHHAASDDALGPYGHAAAECLKPQRNQPRNGGGTQRSISTIPVTWDGNVVNDSTTLMVFGLRPPSRTRSRRFARAQSPREIRLGRANSAVAQPAGVKRIGFAGNDQFLQWQAAQWVLVDWGLNEISLVESRGRRLGLSGGVYFRD